jgi:biopolymer transport protein ExbB
LQFVGATMVAAPAFAQPLSVTQNLTVSTMIGQADPLVKAVMGILLTASIATWTIFLAKLAQLSKAKRQLRLDIGILDRLTSLQTVKDLQYSVTSAMVALAGREVDLIVAPCTAAAAEGVRERVAARLSVVETGAIQSMLTGVSILASIGATAPFIGLAGTVWGIMNSFVGISKVHATNLAVVAPGIAEALLATAMGLMAAIPAVLIYNMLARSIAGYRRMISEAAVLTACALSHDLDSRADGAIGDARSISGDARSISRAIA